MEFDFSKCKTKKDVDIVFNKYKKNIQKIKHLAKLVQEAARKANKTDHL